MQKVLYIAASCTQSRFSSTHCKDSNTSPSTTAVDISRTGSLSVFACVSPNTHPSPAAAQHSTENREPELVQRTVCSDRARLCGIIQHPSQFQRNFFPRCQQPS
ncbi:unnamed protein product [Ectocarpus sp. 12 AP-2014]